MAAASAAPAASPGGKADPGPPAVHTSSNVNSGGGGAGKRRTFKVIVIGDSGVGKTCLTFRYHTTSISRESSKKKYF